MTTGEFRTFLDKWVSPSMLLAVIGGIVWGVQLNFAVLNLVENGAKQATRLEKLEDVNSTQTVSLTRISQVLTDLERRMQKAEEHVVVHEREAEQWKRKILVNEENIRRNEK